MTRPPTMRPNPSKAEILADVRRRTGLQPTDLSAERYEAVVDASLTDLYGATLQQARALLQTWQTQLVRRVPALEYLTAEEQRLLEVWLLSSLRDLALYTPGAAQDAFVARMAQLLNALEPKLRGVLRSPPVARTLGEFYRTTLQWYGQFLGQNLRGLAAHVQDVPAVRAARLTPEQLGQDYLQRFLELLPVEVA